jgi:hypothetical protein
VNAKGSPRRTAVWLAAGVAALTLAEALLFATLRPPGSRLRPLVDLFAVEGILLAVGGAFLVTDRPFLAAREIARRVGRKRATGGAGAVADGHGEAGGAGRWRRVLGWVALLLGVGLFGLAALLWALRGASG